MPRFTTALCAAGALFAAAGQASAHAPYVPPPPPLVTFATYAMTGQTSDLTWANNIIPAVYKTLPAVTKTIPAVTQTIPAVTRLVNGKVVVITPARTIIVTPAQTVIVKPAHTVLVTPAHDGPSGALFSTATGNPAAYGLAQVNFLFLVHPYVPLGFLPAHFSMQAASSAADPATVNGSVLTQGGLSGTFSFTYDGATPLKVWGATFQPGANLLTASTSDFLIAGVKNGSVAGIIGATEAGTPIAFTSDLLDFSKSTERDFAFNLISVFPTLRADPGAALHSFSAGSGGNFSSTLVRPSITPEPAAWSLMLAGMGAMGASLRSRRRRMAAA